MPPANSPAPQPEDRQRKISRLLIVRLSAMGDVIHALPAVAALRAALPQTHIGWVIEERWADLVRCARVKDGDGSRAIADEVHTVNLKNWRRALQSAVTWREALQSIKALRDNSYDVALDFQGAVRSAILARLSGAPSVHGFAEPRENVASIFYTTAVITKEKHVIAQNLALASALVNRELVATPVVFEPAWTENRISHNARYVLLNPGAGWGAKQWPAQRYGEVAKCLATRLQIRSLINAGPGEKELLRAAQEASDGAAEPISCTVAELIEVVKKASLLIGGDTGPTHLAAAMGVPVVAIFGPTDPARTGPFATRSIVLRNPGSRTTTSHERTPDREMLEISTDDVVRAAIQLLRETGE